MRTIDRRSSALLVVDFQSRLMPSIEGGPAAVANARRLMQAATLFEVPTLLTEQNPAGLGGTVPELVSDRSAVAAKMHFDVCREPDFARKLPDRPTVVVAGCEAHVCVLQTVLGLLDGGRHVALVHDALGARRPESKETAIRRMERHGAEVVTTEMVLFEWLETADDSRLRDVIALVR